MKILKKILGQVNLDEKFNEISEGLKKIFHNQDISDSSVVQFIKDILSETTARSVSRRIIALSVTFLFILLVITAWGFLIFNKAELFNETKIFINEIISKPFTLVISFYFGLYVIQKLKDKRE